MRAITSRAGADVRSPGRSRKDAEHRRKETVNAGGGGPFGDLASPRECLAIRAADRGDLRGARRRFEVGRATVNYENVVGLVLSVLLTLFMAAALLYPERF